MKPAEIMTDLSQVQGGDEIKPHYVYTISGPAYRPQWARELIPLLRRLWAEDQAIAHPGWRYEARRRIVEKATDDGSYDAALEALRDVDRQQGLDGGQSAPTAAAQVNVNAGALDGAGTVDVTPGVGGPNPWDDDEAPNDSEA